MKTTVLYSAIISLLISSVFSSCAFIQKEEFAQRKYYNFPRTNHSINAEKTDFTVSKQLKEYSPAGLPEEKTKISESVISASAEKKNIIVSKHHTEIGDEKKMSDKIAKAITSTSLPDDNPVFSFKQSDIRKLARQSSDASISKNPMLMLCIMIVASIILPPVAIYIKESWRITNYFWWTFVLCVISFAGWLLMMPVIGDFYWVPSLCLWLIAVTIALLNVFNVI